MHGLQTGGESVDGSDLKKPVGLQVSSKAPLALSPWHLQGSPGPQTSPRLPWPSDISKATLALNPWLCDLGLGPLRRFALRGCVSSVLCLVCPFAVCRLPFIPSAFALHPSRRRPLPYTLRLAPRCRYTFAATWVTHFLLLFVGPPCVAHIHARPLDVQVNVLAINTNASTAHTCGSEPVGGEVMCGGSISSNSAGLSSAGRRVLWPK